MTLSHRVLFIAPVPPPVTGQSLASVVLLNYLKRCYDVTLVNINKQSFKSGINSLDRMFEILSVLRKIAYRQKDLSVIYITIAESVAGNLKDLLIFAMCYRQLNCTIVHLHGGAGMRKLLDRRRVLFRSINGFFLRRVAKVIVLGERLRPIYSGIVDQSRLAVVPNFAEDYLFCDRSSIVARFACVEPLKILFLSNLLPGKGHVELLCGFQSLSLSDRARISLDFAGGFSSDEDEAHFRSEIAQMPNVAYHGIVSGERKKSLFHSAHVFCLPTYYAYEGQPISILEAYASGCVVLTTEHSGIPDIFADRRNGMLVDIRSPQSICSALERLLGQQQALLAIALNNRLEAESKYREANYSGAIENIVQNVASGAYPALR